jgi:hypothetical protein
MVEMKIPQRKRTNEVRLKKWWEKEGEKVREREGER